jgi:transcription termination factor Rho
MTDITDTPETDAPPEAESPETGNETAAADLPMVDQESGDDEEDDGEPIVPNGRITLQELNEKTPEDLLAFAEEPRRSRTPPPCANRS